MLILMRALDAAGRAADALRAGRPSSPPSHRDRPRTLTRPQRARANHRRADTDAADLTAPRGERPAGSRRRIGGGATIAHPPATGHRARRRRCRQDRPGGGDRRPSRPRHRRAARTDHRPSRHPPGARCGARPARRARRRPVGLRGAARRRPATARLDNCEHLLPGVRDLVAIARRLSTADDDGHQSGAARTPRRTAGATRAAGGDQPR